MYVRVQSIVNLLRGAVICIVVGEEVEEEEGGGVVGGGIQHIFVPIRQFSRLVDNCSGLRTLNFNTRFVSALCIVRVGCLACSSLFSLVCLVCFVPCSVYVVTSCFVLRRQGLHRNRLVDRVVRLQVCMFEFSRLSMYCVVPGFVLL